MLKKRTQLLLSRERWEDLTNLAREKKTSVGELVRQAIEESYFSKEDRTKVKRAIDRIIAIRPHFKGKINYKELINEGRHI